MMRRVSLTAAVAAALVAAIVPSAGAAERIGQAVPPTTAGQCLGNGIWLQTSTPGGNAYAVPHAGVITRWTFNPGPAPARLKFKVGRPVVPEGRYEIVGEHPAVTAPANGVTSYPAQIPVQAKDVIGFYLVADAYCAREQEDDDWGYHFLAGDMLPGAPPVHFANAAPIEQLSVSALLEPDCDGDGLGDDTQDDDTSSCPRCLGRVATVVGTPERDLLRGTTGRDVIVGAGGNDKLVGDDGHDIICGGGGHDLLAGGAGKDALLGHAGDDRLLAGIHRDRCTGGAGDDGGRACERGSEAT
jgi:hypothetical protein